MRWRGRLTLVALALLVGVALRSLLPPLSSFAAAPTPAPVEEPVAPDTAPLMLRLPVDPAHYAGAEESLPGTRLTEEVPLDPVGSFRVEYTLDAALGHAIVKELRRSKASLAHVVVLDPASGELLAYVSSDPERFPPTRAYPAASLVKVVTAAAVLPQLEDPAAPSCRTVGSPWRLTRRRLDPAPGGRPVSLRRALAISDNQCFAQIAVHQLGRQALLDAIDRFGLLHRPAPSHAAGEAEDPGEDALALGRLGCGLDGCRITPLHAAQMAAVLVEGKLVEPRWIARVTDPEGREVPLPEPAAARRILEPELADQLRELLVDTTVRGTARKAFRTRRGPLLQGIRVAGKTGSLSGREPRGRYEWFMAVAPADEPRVALSVLLVHGDRWWVTPSQVAAEVLKVLFCPRGVCRVAALERWRPQPVAEPAISAGRVASGDESRGG